MKKEFKIFLLDTWIYLVIMAIIYYPLWFISDSNKIIHKSSDPTVYYTWFDVYAYILVTFLLLTNAVWIGRQTRKIAEWFIQ